MNIYVVTALIALAAFFVVILIGTIFLTPKNGETQLNKSNDSKDIDNTKSTIKKLGIETTDYLINCNIANKEPEYELLIRCRIGTLLSIMAGIVIGIITFNIYIVIPFMLIGLVLMEYPTKKMKKYADDRKAKLNSELPRFLDILQASLKANLPIIQAIEKTTNCLDGVISEELQSALSEAKLGNKSWQDALFDVAKKFENDEFSDFVLDLTTSYAKGVSITDTVENKSADIKKSNLLLAKEKSTQISNRVLIPVMVFEMVPMLAFILIPVAVQILNTF